MAWAAGLFEGEGSIHICGCTRPDARWKHKQLRARLNMIDRDVVERFARAVGAGSVTYIAPREAHHKPQWQWMSTNYEVVQWLVIRFWPLLGERRREQAKRALQTIQEYKQEIAARRRAA